ncbi:MAG: pyridoxamine 5'-phosphate oxidase [Bacteroidetes bacterium]|nr:MAG: pyridoxamine 5'-phosphate oxidase [Bacteroidota bacterium]
MSNQQDIAQIRKDYSLKKLDEKEVNQNPFSQFKVWLEQAIQSEIIEPTAMNLATIGENNRPTSRIVLLKEVQTNGFVFFSNYQSKKGKEMFENPYVALNFFWAELERQVRIEGIVEKIPQFHSLEYFVTRPKASQLGAVASPQSEKVENRLFLEQKFEALEKEYAEKNVPKPTNWGGYKVIPTYFEFWQGRRSRLHDRIVYEKQDNNWNIARVAP